MRYNSDVELIDFVLIICSNSLTKTSFAIIVALGIEDVVYTGGQN